MNTLVFSPQEAREIVCGDHEDFTVVSKTIVGRTRWSIWYEVVVQKHFNGKFYLTHYSCGATESQDELPYEYSDPDFIEVEPCEKTIIAYREVKPVV